jgi:hypothetical protein
MPNYDTNAERLRKAAEQRYPADRCFLAGNRGRANEHGHSATKGPRYLTCTITYNNYISLEKGGASLMSKLPPISPTAPSRRVSSKSTENCHEQRHHGRRLYEKLEPGSNMPDLVFASPEQMSHGVVPGLSESANSSQPRESSIASARLADDKEDEMEDWGELWRAAESQSTEPTALCDVQDISTERSQLGLDLDIENFINQAIAASIESRHKKTSKPGDSHSYHNAIFGSPDRELFTKSQTWLDSYLAYNSLDQAPSSYFTTSCETNACRIRRTISTPRLASSQTNNAKSSPNFIWKLANKFAN